VTAAEPGNRDLAGQVIIVTGGGGGIGAAVCRRLAGAGAHVVAADISQAAAEATAAGIGAGRATAVTADVSDPASVASLVRDTVTRHGRLDAVVNNAGIVVVEPLDLTSLETWRRTFAVNTEGPLLLMQAAAAVMLTQDLSPATGCRGKFITVSSEAAEHGRLMVPAYGASKAALNHLSRSAAVRWGPDGISTTIVYPGDVEGAMWPGVGARIAAAEGRSADEVIAERLAAAPSGRFQRPDEVADAVLFAAAFRGPDLNGTVIWTQAHVAGP
jgi:NAD(P)-dependent dehydrogenase (short-subunit alcohol dehydrogenase family)